MSDKQEWKSSFYDGKYKQYRAKRIAARGNACERCDLHTPYLQTHHLHYYSHNCLIALCAECHVVADSIRALGYDKLERSASLNWKWVRALGEDFWGEGWFVHLSAFEIVKIVYQEWLIVLLQATPDDVIKGRIFLPTDFKMARKEAHPFFRQAFNEAQQERST